MFEKEISELQQKIDKLNQEMLNINKIEAQKYVNILKKYVNENFDYFNITIKTYRINDNAMEFVYNGIKHDSYVPRENRLFTIQLDSKSDGIYKVITHSEFDLSYNDYSEKDLEFLFKREDLCFNVKKAVFKHKAEIEQEFLKIKTDDTLGKLLDFEKLLNSMFNFLNKDAKIELNIDKLLMDKGGKIDGNNYVYVSGFNGNGGYFNEIKFFKNPSGTYSVQLIKDGEIASSSNRASYDNLMQLVRRFANGI
jgi:hypothetical protein